MPIFDLSRIQSEAGIAHIDYHDTLPSTNSLALEMLSEFCQRAPALVLTERQSAGRGRSANRWFSDGGALTFSFVPAPERLPTKDFSMLSLVTGIAIRRVLQRVLLKVDCSKSVQIKWPNDLLIGGQKVCGILVENNATSQSAELVIGAGINVNNSTQMLDETVRHTATSLHDLTSNVFDLTDLLIQILVEIQADIDRLAQCQTVDLIQELNAFHVLTGCFVQVNQGNTLVRGICRRVDDFGALVVQTADGEQTVRSGTVDLWQP